MNFGLPNKALQRTRLLRLSFAMSLRFTQRLAGRVELGRLSRGYRETETGIAIVCLKLGSQYADQYL